jgi:predicted nucleic acid-binding protein
MANLRRFLASPRVEILHVDDNTPKLFGKIAAEFHKAGQPIHQDDMWIAALCKQYGYALATTDAGFAAIMG